MGKNKVVIISGGTSGIGLATAKILASEEWKTILLGRDMNKGRGAQEEAQGSLFNCIFDYPCICHITGNKKAALSFFLRPAPLIHVTTEQNCLPLF